MSDSSDTAPVQRIFTASPRTQPNGVLSALEETLDAAEMAGHISASTRRSGDSESESMPADSERHDGPPELAVQLAGHGSPLQTASSASAQCSPHTFQLPTSASPLQPPQAAPARSTGSPRVGWLSSGRSLSDAAAAIEKATRSPAWRHTKFRVSETVIAVSPIPEVQAPLQQAPLPVAAAAEQSADASAQAAASLRCPGTGSPLVALAAAVRVPVAGRRGSASSILLSTTRFAGTTGTGASLRPQVTRSFAELAAAPSSFPILAANQLAREAQAAAAAVALQTAGKIPRFSLPVPQFPEGVGPPAPLAPAAGVITPGLGSPPISPRQSARRLASAAGVRFVGYPPTVAGNGSDNRDGPGGDSDDRFETDEESRGAAAAAAACSAILRASRGPAAAGSLLAADAATLAAGSGVFSDEEPIVTAASVALLAQRILHAQLSAGSALDRSLRLHLAETFTASPLERADAPGQVRIQRIRAGDHPAGFPGAAAIRTPAARSGGPANHAAAVAALRLDWARATAYAELLRRTGGAELTSRTAGSHASASGIQFAGERDDRHDDERDAAGLRSRHDDAHSGRRAGGPLGPLASGLRECLRFMREVRSILLQTCAAATLDIAQAVAVAAADLCAAPPTLAASIGSRGTGGPDTREPGMLSPTGSLGSPARSTMTEGASRTPLSPGRQPALRVPTSSDLRAAARASADVLLFFQVLRDSVVGRVASAAGAMSAAAAAVQLLVRVRSACRRLQAELHSIDAAAAVAAAGLEAELSSVFATGRQVRFSGTFVAGGAAADVSHARANGTREEVAQAATGRPRRGSLVSILGGARTVSSGRSATEESRTYHDDEDLAGEGHASESARRDRGKTSSLSQLDDEAVASDAVLLRGLLSREWDGRTFGAESDVPSGARRASLIIMMSPSAPTAPPLQAFSPAVQVVAAAALRGADTGGATRSGWKSSAAPPTAINQVLGASGLVSPMSPSKAPGSRLALAAWRRMPSPPLPSTVLPSFDSAAPQPRPATALAVDAVQVLRDPSTFAALVAAPIASVAAAAEAPVPTASAASHDHADDASSAASDDYHDHDHHDDASSVASDASMLSGFRSRSRDAKAATAAASYGEARAVIVTNTWLLWRHALLHVQWHMRQRAQRLLASSTGAGLDDPWTAIIAPEAFLPGSAAALLRPRTVAHAASAAAGASFVPLHRDGEARRTADLHAALCVYRLLEGAALASTTLT